MDEQLTGPAKRLARWCYDRGVDERVLAAGEQLLAAPSPRRSAAEQRPTSSTRCGSTSPVCCTSATNGTPHTAPPAAACLWCAIAPGDCPEHTPCRCRVCPGAMHRSILQEGFDTHPCCDRAVGAGTDADLEYLTQMLGATPLLPQPA